MRFKKENDLKITNCIKKVDIDRGAEYIPKKVQKAREEGIIVRFIVEGAKKFWLFPDKKRIYHN